MNRRQFVAAGAVGGVSVSASCLDDFLEDATTFSATPAVVAESATDDTGYEYQGTEEIVSTESVAGQEIEVTSYGSEYTRPIDLPLDIFGGEIEAGVFAVISTPQVSVAGEEFNPVGEMENEELVQEIQTQYEELRIEESVGERSVSALEETITLETFEGEAVLHGEHGIDILLDIAQLEHDDDYLVIVGVYPDLEDFPIDSERDRIDVMVQGLEHDDDVDAEIVESREEEEPLSD
ncbi:hypothetical protein C491_08649 [Natronococcus amylolyticus DSM 10524]|uniref:Uncharacterized protein n=1 Tax=Natronococcus amylolyticus DSM 10524 TaxID=1227497 RepID=L9XAC3_9EURY|nr:DUF6517 family protein [Natronococcus amylolyticus]ELY58391.1 hypothetical protein C491_08649 [Natronococcus amylolyticus DSM 10524]